MVDQTSGDPIATQPQRGAARAADLRARLFALRDTEPDLAAFSESDV